MQRASQRELLHDADVGRHEAGAEEGDDVWVLQPVQNLEVRE